MVAGSSAPARDDLAHWVDWVAEKARHDVRIDAFEVRADERADRRFAMRDGDPKGTRLNRSGGLGVRIFSGGGVSYVHAAEFEAAALRRILDRGVELAQVNGKLSWKSFPPALRAAGRATYAPAVDGAPIEAPVERVLEVMQRAEAGVRDVAPEARTQVAFGARAVRTLLASSTGTWNDTSSLLSTLIVRVIERDGSRVGDGVDWRGGERGVGDYEDEGGPEAMGREAAARARESLEAVSFPSGRYRVLCDNELSGTLAHESFGHLTEYDLVSSGWSTLQGRRGETFAAPGVSVSDAPRVEGSRKEGVVVPYDDEGTPGRKVALLDDGVLARWMHTRDSASQEGDEAAGNGRALDARFPPIVRMRNTFFEPGKHSFEEALEALGDGVYLVGARGGAPRSDGSFMFTSVRGYLVEKGELGAPVRSASIHGNVLDFLKNVEILTGDFRLFSNYFGGCGKGEQSFLHVGIGGPHVLVDDALVGGQGA